MSRIFVIDDDRVADAIELLLEKKKRMDKRRIHSFSDHEPSYVRPSSGCGMTHSYYGGCGGTLIHSSGCGSVGCGGYRTFGTCG